MSLFFLSFFLIYSSLHFYIYLSAWRALHFRWGSGVIIALVFFLMIVSSLAVRFLERGGHDLAARIAACVGYSWLGFVFLFFTLTLCFDVARLLMYGVSALSKVDFSWFISAYRPCFYITLVVALICSFYGYTEALNIRPERLRIETKKLSNQTRKITIVQISDVHLGLIVGNTKLRRIVELIKEADPHMLVSTGDLVDGDIDSLEGFADLLREVKPPYGKYAVTGNHEFYAGLENALDFHRKAGFRMLRGECTPVSGVLNVAGVDDPAGAFFDVKAVSEKALLSGAPREFFTVLLKHRPVVDGEAVPLIDLQLSGHTHKGQIYPFRYLTRLAFPLYTGYHKISENGHLYVSRGTGTWGPPIRFLAPPEVTVIELVPAR